jgi:predicted Zn-dependent protease
MPDYRPRKELESVVLDDELMIFDPVRDETHILNETAAEIWRLLTEKKSVSEIMDHCFEQYQTGEKEDLRKTLQVTLNQLNQKGLLIPADFSETEQQEGEELEAALSRYERLLSETPEDPLVLGNLGVFTFQSGRWPEAEALLVRARGLDPDNSILTFNLAALWYRQGRAAEAWEILKKIESRHPGNVHLLSLSGKILTALGRLEEAKDRLLRALASDPELINLYNELALVYLLLDQPEAAEAQLAAALERSRLYPDTFRNLGNLRLKQNNPEAAEGYFRQTLELDPREVLARYPLAWIYFQRRAFDRAVQEAEGCLQQNPTWLPPYEILVQVYQAQGDRVQALLIYSRARKAVPDFNREAFPSLTALEQEVLKNTS